MIKYLKEGWCNIHTHLITYGFIRLQDILQTLKENTLPQSYDQLNKELLLGTPLTI